MKLRRIAAVLLTLVLAMQLLPVTAEAALAYPVYVQTVKDSVALRDEIGSENPTVTHVAEKGTVLRCKGAEKHYYGFLNMKYNVWYRVTVDDEYTTTGEGGEYWLYEGNVTAHKHDMEGLDCASYGCPYTERPTMTQLNSKEEYWLTTKPNVCIRKEAYDTAEKKWTAPNEGDTIYTVGKYLSSRDTVWYKTGDGGWIYSGNIRPATKSELEIIINTAIQVIADIANGGTGGGSSSSGSTSSGSTSSGSSGGTSISMEALKKLPEKILTFTPCVTHKWSVGQCVNCGETYDMTVLPYQGTFQTTDSNVWAYALPYNNASQAKLYADKGTLVSVSGVATNALKEQWYCTSEGYWINKVQNVTLGSISLSAANHTFSTLGETLKLKCTSAPVNAVYTAQWSSDNPAVATVDSTGKVTAVSGGDATITCTATAHNGKIFTAQTKVKVAKAADYEVWDYSNAHLEDDLLKECSTYMCLAYPSYSYKIVDDEILPYIAKEGVVGDMPAGLIKLLKKQGMKYQVYNYNADEMTEENSPFVIAEKLVNYEGEVTPVLYVIIEGSAGKPGWQGNMKVTGADYNASRTRYTYEHYTFSASAIDIQDKLDAFVEDQGYGDVKPLVVITGHSRGAAVGNLLADHLDNDSYYSGRIYAYTFATPNCTTRPDEHDFIYNICNETDMVTYIPLSKGWGYEKNGQTYSFNASAQYKAGGSFTRYVKELMKLSSANYNNRTKPDYDYELCTVPMMRDYVAGKWRTLQNYYHHTGVYVLCNDLQLYDYFYNNLALSACEDGLAMARLAYHLHPVSGIGDAILGSVGCPYQPISAFFGTSGVSKIESFSSFADSHQAFTYHAAVLSGVYDSGSGADLLGDVVEYGNDNGVALNADEQETLLDFFCDEDVNQLAAEEAGWDLEDPTTWQGVLWDMDGYIVELDLSYMGIEGSLNLSGMERLQSLDLDGNGISNLGVARCAELTELSCFVNDLSRLDVSGCEELVSLNCALNRLETLSLDNAKLTDLNCSANALTRLDVSGSPELSSLRCSSNNLTSLDLDGLNSLSVVFCGGNQIIESENDDLLSALAAIEEEGGTAKLGTQQYNEDYSFNAEELSALTEFADLSLNQDALGWDPEDPWSWQGVEWKIYGDEYHVASVNLNGMPVEGTLNLPEAEYLESLSCENTGLSAVNLSGCTNLSSLNCTNAGLLDLDVSACDSLSSLSCAGNNLSVSETNDALSQLPGLDLQGAVSYENQNILDEETNFHPDELEVLWNFLSLGGNGETLGWDLERPGTWDGVVWTEDEEGYYRVQKLNFASRYVVGELDLSGFVCLADIDLSGSGVTSVSLPGSLVIVPEYAFYGSALQELYLGEGIAVIEPYAFAYCEELKTVVLPDTMARVEDGAFFGCTKLRDAVFTGDAPVSTGADVFRDTDSQFSIRYFADAAWSGEEEILGQYISNIVTDDTLLILDPEVELYTDDTFGPLNQYCGHDITVTLVTRKDALEGACWLAVYNDQGRLVSSQLKQVAADGAMTLCTFDDVEIQYVGAESCSFKTFLVEPSSDSGPISDSLNCVLLKPAAEEEV